MRKQEFQTHLKRMIDELRQDTLHKLVKHDSDYQEYCKEMTVAERAYTKLELSQEQRQLVDEYLSLADMVNMEYCTFSYLAGILDSHKITDLFQLKEKIPENNSFVKDLFNDTFLLAKNFTESEKSKSLLNDLSTAEQNFLSTLNSEQQKSFKTLFFKRSDYISSTSGDAFFYGFQLATTILTETLL